MTETYVAMQLAIDNWRWAGVPFYLRTGKALTRRTTEIAIQFKRAPFALFRDTPVERADAELCWRCRSSPTRASRCSSAPSSRGRRSGSAACEMDFKYRDYFHTEPSTGYETLVYDAMIGDAMLFQRADSVEAGWCAVQPILDVWHNDPKGVPLEFYPAGTAGPEAAEKLLWRSGRKWRPIA